MTTTYTLQQVQENLVATMNWGVKHHGQFKYSEGKDRMEAVRKPFALPITSDCSSWVTSICFWNGLNDPNGLKFNGQGYTGTLLSHLPHIDKSKVRVGDLVVYGGGTGTHVAMVANVDAHGNILTCSMGQDGDPSWTWVNKPVMEVAATIVGVVTITEEEAVYGLPPAGVLGMGDITPTTMQRLQS